MEVASEMSWLTEADNVLSCLFMSLIQNKQTRLFKYTCNITLTFSAYTTSSDRNHHADKQNCSTEPFRLCCKHRTSQLRLMRRLTGHLARYFQLTNNIWNILLSNADDNVIHNLSIQPKSTHHSS